MTRRGYGTAKELSMNYLHSTQGKERSVTVFDIQLDHPEDYQYQPGEEISGVIVIDIIQNLEIRYVEFIIGGYGAASIINPKHGLTHSKKEVYLDKRRIMLGTLNGRYTSLITPGRYSSKFKFILPLNIPASMQYHDPKGSFYLNINYFVKTRVCDSAHHFMSTRSYQRVNAKKVVRVIMMRKKTFVIHRDFDINKVPMALWPVAQSEEMSLGCGPFDSEHLHVTGVLERRVYLSGDSIRLSFEVPIAYIRKIRHIYCELRQNVSIKDNLEHIHSIVSSTHVENIDWKIERRENERPHAACKIKLQTPFDLLPSLIPGCKIIKVSYLAKATLRVTNHSSRMHIDIPVSIGPSNEIFPLNLSKSGALAFPVFNRPIRFPNFSPSNDTTLNTTGTINRSLKVSFGLGSQRSHKSTQSGESLIRSGDEDADETQALIERQSPNHMETRPTKIVKNTGSQTINGEEDDNDADGTVKTPPRDYPVNAITLKRERTAEDDGSLWHHL